MTEIEQWDRFELELQGPSHGNPFLRWSLAPNLAVTVRC